MLRDEKNSHNFRPPDFKEIILSRNLLKLEDYENAEKLANEFGQNIQEYLYKSGDIPHLDLQQAIALSQGVRLEFVNDRNHNGKHILPHKLSAENGYNLIEDYEGLNATTMEDGIHLAYGFSENSAAQHKQGFVTARDFRSLFIEQNKDLLNHQATNLLADNLPDLTAKDGMHENQTLALFIILLGMFIALCISPITSYYILCILLSCIFLFASSVKIYSLFMPKIDRHNRPNADASKPFNLPLSELPIYSILVPLNQEANVIEQLTDNLLKLNYPRSKLDIKLLFEEDDHETISAAKQLNLPECFEFIIVPESQPRTKPKAMNFALPFVRGSYVTIYDAEDKPEPDQLLKALHMFSQSDDKLACLQSNLEYENWDENWLSRHFFIEYATHFNRFLIALERLGIPLPLGGTSNHFKTHILRELYGWDAYNVTEDADLGIRLALYGYRSGILNSYTLEEANHKLFPWIAQRTRWIKGWFQTVIVHSRNPMALYKSIGFFRFVGFMALICGIIFSSLMHPVIFLIPFILYHTIDLNEIMNSYLHLTMFVLGILTIIIGYGTAFYSNLQAIREYKRRKLLSTLFSAPIYWLLISTAAWFAVYKYITDPFSWAKTQHGVSKYLQQEAVKAKNADKQANKFK